MITVTTVGRMYDSVEHLPAADHPELLAATVAGRAAELPSAVVFSIDPEIADTDALCEAFGEGPETCGNCVIVKGKRGDVEKYVACLALATTRVDVNKVVRKKLDVRKASFAPMDEAVSLSGMEYGGITPVGLPAEWPIWIDPRVAEAQAVCIGSGLRSSKLIVSGADLVSLPGAEVVEGLAN
ncbi:hypothetical protein HMPREF1279_00577 [Propionibacterium sp. KPL1852]|uniref:YbaK/prolyl-tRNA synthetase associated region n=2 Tax=Cutibacterium avidum TaxID=33010 RepID=G4CWG6_9ACTN|nr:YbaK/prolyl-tRNA synthetase associated region [Cutibacterium avidum ATCC 25577]ERS41078.1 hypothetical protein HMPREF1271_00705 [Propionibacterium sp. KPL1838]ERS68215.1 hypothetical protein HMPREF1279_00577 [Propionibacterium sp. KPL1852]